LNSKYWRVNSKGGSIWDLGFGIADCGCFYLVFKLPSALADGYGKKGFSGFSQRQFKRSRLNKLY
jgi:hypothetical protein